MSRLDKDFKKEVNKVVSEGSYLFLKVGIRILLVVGILATLIVFGKVMLKKFTVEKEREIFKQSVTYTENAASFLADSYKQYKEAETESEKNTIMEYVVMRYPNLDVDEIDNEELKNFYNKCVIGGN